MTVVNARKLPRIVQAVQLRLDNMAEIEEFVGGDIGNTAEGLVIATLEGAMHVSLGDWVIRGVQGEFYPCKPDIFAETYEILEDES